MIAKPDERNRLMQKLKAETCIRRESGNRDERTDEGNYYRRILLGTLSPYPWHLSL